MRRRLTTIDHSRDVAGLTYVYPVISRRAGGLSVGINFNINNACNWRCVYCQVPELIRGSAPPLDFALLEDELTLFLEQVLHGDFYQRFEVPAEQRTIKDIAISGNGEPTSVPEFAEAVRLIGEIAEAKGVFPSARFVLISNGSLMHQTKVQEGLKQINRFGGEVWFKIDSATKAGRRAINNSLESDERVLEHLRICTRLCRTKLQTCLMDFSRLPWTEGEQRTYLELLARIKNDIELDGVLLYSIARKSMQPEAGELTPLSAERMMQFALRIEELGYKVSISV